MLSNKANRKDNHSFIRTDLNGMINNQKSVFIKGSFKIRHWHLLYMSFPNSSREETLRTPMRSHEGVGLLAMIGEDPTGEDWYIT